MAAGHPEKVKGRGKQFRNSRRKHRQANRPQIITEMRTTSTTTGKEIKALTSKGWTPDQIYEKAAGKLGLYAVAFFGHQGSTSQRAALSRVWKRILKHTTN